MTYIPIQNGGTVQPFGTVATVVTDPELDRLKAKHEKLMAWLIAEGFDLPEELLEDV